MFGAGSWYKSDPWLRPREPVTHRCFYGTDMHAMFSSLLHAYEPHHFSYSRSLLSKHTNAERFLYTSHRHWWKGQMRLHSGHIRRRTLDNITVSECWRVNSSCILGFICAILVDNQKSRSFHDNVTSHEVTQVYFDWEQGERNCSTITIVLAIWIKFSWNDTPSSWSRRSIISGGYIKFIRNSNESSRRASLISFGNGSFQFNLRGTV